MTDGEDACGNDWIPCENAPSAALRNVLAQLPRRALLMVSDGERVARVRDSGQSSFATARNGSRIDVLPDPVIEECEWIASIQQAGDVWFMRENAHVQDPPAVRWY